MNKPFSLSNSLMLAPLIGVTDTLPKALSFFGLCALIGVLYGFVMQGVRQRPNTQSRLSASIVLAATLVSCTQVLLQAFALPVYQQLGVYLALISVQCVVLEHSGFFDAGQGKARLQLFGLFGALLIILGLLRTILGTTLVPAGFILLGLLLAGFQAWNLYSKPR
ncbi:hypothetical protein PspS35_06525 [Pseudomonas sp. S35]|uniref:Rnf-Nqr domain containing protein n=1 Tax=Pseudomonas sp. S35 TaxID=1573719 RepID=UPI00132E9E83|nr:Rnf-Nqr domain containing protein [Pseudomonas sp. S35]QHF43465.1 hypothetical protein PspS35_06525 [Pseudomonas sp. S35]